MAYDQKLVVPVDVNVADGKNIKRVINALMFAVADIKQPVISAPAVRMNYRINRNTSANNVLQRLPSRVWNNFGEDTTISFVDSKDDGFARGAATTLAAHPTRPEIRFVDFDLASRKWRSAFRFFGDAVSDFQINSIDALVRQYSQLSGFVSRQIKGKILDDLTSFPQT